MLSNTPHFDVVRLSQNSNFHNENSPLHQQLNSATDFCLVEDDILSQLSVLRREYGALDVIAELGTPALHCWVVLQGTVDVFRFTDHIFRRCGCIVPPNSFGGDDVIMKTHFQFLYKAGPTRTVIALIPATEYIALIRRHRSFAQSIGRRIIERYDIFSRFRTFCKEIFTTQEMVDVPSLVAKYYELDSVIHTHITDPFLDTSAWTYGVNRLPNNITTTFVFDLVRVLPTFLSSRMKNLTTTGHNAHGVIYVPTKDRRRYSWQMGVTGKTLVLLRDGFTDLLDFLTCFCIHIVESRKLRVRITSSPNAVDTLENAVLRGEGSEDDVLAAMPFTPEERIGLKQLWPNNNLLQSMYDMMMRKEMYLVRVAETTNSYEIDPFHAWMLNIRGTLLNLLGLAAQEELPSNLSVDIISSNNHSVKNLLSPFVRQNRIEILEWANQKMSSVTAMTWPNEEDMLYFVLPKYLASDPELERRHRDELLQYGIGVIDDTSLTGLSVEVYLVAQLDFAKIDTTLAKRRGVCLEPDDGNIHVIINMDFAFGAQADGIMRSLILLLGTRISSVNVIGKAGGLQGERGDVQLPSHVIFSKSSLLTEDATDDFRTCDNRDVSDTRLGELCKRSVHAGPVLTIPGTLLQSHSLLQYYKTIWGCVGVEMEGSYFARQVMESMNLGLIASSVRMRFAYYTSDLPLVVSSETNLSTPMKPTEGVPVLYGITRAFVELILFPRKR